MALPGLSLAGLRRAGALIGSGLRRHDLVLLQGPIGAGKSELARSIVRAACQDALLAVPSPTFLLALEYQGKEEGLPILHVDLHRLYLTTPAFDRRLVSRDGAWCGVELIHEPDLHAIGWHQALEHGAVVCEWPQGLAAGAVLSGAQAQGSPPALLVSLEPGEVVPGTDEWVEPVIRSLYPGRVLEAREAEGSEEVDIPRGTDMALQWIHR
jgi:hypothetical protein